MNKIILISIFLSSFLVYGCNPFLDEEPDARAKVETVQDIKELLVNAYPQATYHLIAETMSDNAFDLGTGLNSATQITDYEMYTWREGTSSDYDAPFSVWTGLYAGIAVANHALRELEELPESPEVRALKGEALLCRAFGHFLLVNLWAEHYDPATETTALGIPYVTEPEDVAVKQYKRDNMKDTYEKIEMDLRRGISMVDDDMYAQPKFHFTKRAAHAFAARFYAYKGTEWDKVLIHANQAIAVGDFSYEMRDLYSMNSLGALEYMRQYTLPTQPSIILSVTVPTYWNDMYRTCPPRNSRYTLAPTQLSAIIPIISGRSIIGTGWVYRTEGAMVSPAVSMAKGYAYFKNESMTSNRGMTYLNVPMLTVEDVAFCRMEANIMLGDSLAVIRDLNYFQKVRCRQGSYSPMTMQLINEYYDNVPEGQLLENTELLPHYKDQLDTRWKHRLLRTVLMFRRMEFLQEGLRWFDIKRFHLTVEHNIERSADGVRKDVLGPYDLRRALQIPQEAIKVGVEANERPANENV